MVRQAHHERKLEDFAIVLDERSRQIATQPWRGYNAPTVDARFALRLPDDFRPGA